ncbi:hypothetical protein L6452_21271 [Arctium lappa]|uniref:Uncharacterized protein n=1 Tax=Arctium lappa TaxID=4217 RepID=A0ACB9BI24_ARCLA|nr:hypothetical protein L6452_21271 [Arctium lappa]
MILEVSTSQTPLDPVAREINGLEQVMKKEVSVVDGTEDFRATETLAGYPGPLAQTNLLAKKPTVKACSTEVKPSGHKVANAGNRTRVERYELPR